MKQLFTAKIIHNIFIFSIILKALNAAIEIIGGILVFVISQEIIIKTVLFFTREELSEDSKDVIANLR